MKKKKNNNVFMISVIGIIILCFAGLWYVSSVQEKGAKEGLPTEEELKGFKAKEVVDFDYDNQPMIGKKDAPVKVVEFGDYKCPACKMWKGSVYPILDAEYIKTGKIQFYFINYQFLGPDSILAGIAGEAIYKQSEEAFWKYYTLIYEKQGPESEIWANQNFLLNLVKKELPEIDYKQFEKDLKEKKYLNDVLQDREIAAKYGVNSTPSIFVNGKKVESIDYPGLKQIIDGELKK